MVPNRKSGSVVAVATPPVLEDAAAVVEEEVARFLAG